MGNEVDFYGLEKWQPEVCSDIWEFFNDITEKSYIVIRYSWKVFPANDISFNQLDRSQFINTPQMKHLARDKSEQPLDPVSDQSWSKNILLLPLQSSLMLMEGYAYSSKYCYLL